MSQKSNQALALIEWHEKRNSWPHDVAHCQWQGSLDATWSKYVGENLLEGPTNDINHLKDLDGQFNKRRGCSFVYLWRFYVMDRVFFKVGVTNSLQTRFNSFRKLLPKAVMPHCEVSKVSKVGKSYSLGKAGDIELNFIVASRRFHLGNEWFDFKDEMSCTPLSHETR